MRIIVVGSLICLSAVCRLTAQTSSLHAPNTGSSGSSGIQTQPFKVDSAGLKGILKNFSDCKSTTLAGAKQEVEVKTRNALLAGTAMAVVELLSADTPEGRAASEFVPILVSKLRVPAALGIFDETEIKVYEGRGYKPNDAFEVCSPTVGFSQFTMVRPRAPSLIPLSPPEPLPTLSLSTEALGLKAFSSQQDLSSLASSITPACDVSDDAIRDLRMSQRGYGTLSGKVSELGGALYYHALDKMLASPRPALTAQVDLVGPSPGSCITFKGEFSFYVTEGSYRLTVSQFADKSDIRDLTIRAHEDKRIEITLLPANAP